MCLSFSKLAEAKKNPQTNKQAIETDRNAKFIPMQ